MKKTLSILTSGILSWAAFAESALAQERVPATESTESPPPAIYPRVSMATWYRVDRSWPKDEPKFGTTETPGVAVGPDGNIYVAVRDEPPIRVYSPEGDYLRGFGSAEIAKTHHLKFDPNGDLWLADIGDHTLKRFSRDGALLEILGTPGEKGNDNDHFNMPTDIVVTPEGERFVSDGYGNGRIVHLDREGQFVKAWGKLGVGPGEFSIPHAIAIDSDGRLYVADRNNVRVQIFNQNGELLDIWNNVIVPWGFHITPEDEIWICGSSPMPWRLTDLTLGCPPKDQVFMKFATTGRLIQQWTVPMPASKGTEPGECDWVHCIAADEDGNLYVGDIKGGRIQRFSPRTNGELQGGLRFNFGR